MKIPPVSTHAAQTATEAQAFVEAFARVTVRAIRDALGRPVLEAGAAEQILQPDWDDPEKLDASGLSAEQVDEEARRGQKYLHVDVALTASGGEARKLFLAFTGLSDKQQRLIFPALKAHRPGVREEVSREVSRLNHWLDDIREGGFDPASFVAYQRGIGIHGRIQNTSGAIGAAGAVVAFVDCVEEICPGAIVDSVGEIPPADIRSPSDLYDWLTNGPNRTTKALLLKNGRAIVFASSKDANIFQPLGAPFVSAAEALKRFNAVAKNKRDRSQQLHEFAVGEVKTATDPANLHERMGLASRETQTELRTDRFLMMALLNADILEGGLQKRTMNNQDLVRFSDVFNLHHCWGWDGGRVRNPDHWDYFKAKVGEWCGL